jgi:hypothetical protein
MTTVVDSSVNCPPSLFIDFIMVKYFSIYGPGCFPI